MELVNVLHNISTENLRDYQIPKTDTDGDGIYDYYEYSVGTDINNADTDDDSALDGDEIFEQMYTENTKEDTVINSLSVKTNCAGLLDEQITIEDVSNIDTQTANVVGIVGNPYEITCNAEFEKATISFSYDDTKLGTTDESDLRVMWYDEENDDYVI